MKSEEIKTRVKRYLHTSVDDCKAGLPFEENMTVLTELLFQCGVVGHISRANVVARRIGQLVKGV